MENYAPEENSLSPKPIFIPEDESEIVMPKERMTVQLANEEDIFQISKLYYDVYQGTYPDPLMKDFILIGNFIKSTTGFWFVSKDSSNHIIGSVLACYDQENLIAK